MTNLQIAITVLLALLVGALFPVLFQVRSTMRALERRLTSTRLEETLADLHVAARGFRVLGKQLEMGEREIGDAVQALQDLTYSIRKLKHSAKVVSALGAAVGPAIAAAVRAFQDHRNPSSNVEEEAAGAKNASQDNVAAIGQPAARAEDRVDERRRAP